MRVTCKILFKSYIEWAKSQNLPTEAFINIGPRKKKIPKSPKCIWIFNKFQDFILDFPSVPFSFQIFVFKTTLYIRVAHSEQRLGLFESTILCKITLRCKVLSNKITMYIQNNLIFRCKFADNYQICFAKKKNGLHFEIWIFLL